MERRYSFHEAANLLNVSEFLLERWFRSGILAPPCEVEGKPLTQENLLRFVCGHRAAIAEDDSPLELLIVDDDTTLLRLFRLMANRMGISVVTTPNAYHGIILAHLLLPTAVLIDYHLPGISGAEVCRQLSPTLETRIFGMTASFDTSILNEMKSAGATYCVEKPDSLKAFHSFTQLWSKDANTAQR